MAVCWGIEIKRRGKSELAGWKLFRKATENDRAVCGAIYGLYLQLSYRKRARHYITPTHENFLTIAAEIFFEE